MTPELIRSIASLLWPILALVASYKLWPYILKLTKDATDVKIKIGEYELSSSKQTNDIFIKPILNEIDEAIATLISEQRSEFVRIYNSIEVQGKELEVSSDFVRGSEYHYTLRALRNINFIQPVGGGNWKPKQKISLKNFGRLAAKLRAKELGF